MLRLGLRHFRISEDLKYVEPSQFICHGPASSPTRGPGQPGVAERAPSEIRDTKDILKHDAFVPWVARSCRIGAKLSGFFSNCHSRESGNPGDRGMPSPGVHHRYRRRFEFYGPLGSRWSLRFGRASRGPGRGNDIFCLVIAIALAPIRSCRAMIPRSSASSGPKRAPENV